MLTHEEASTLIRSDPRNREIIFPVINGQEVNNNPKQNPGRSISIFSIGISRRHKNMTKLFIVCYS